MPFGFDIFRKLETGEVVSIASRSSLEEATELLNSLQQQWPGDYSIREGCVTQPAKPRGSFGAGDRTALFSAGVRRRQQGFPFSM
jgi:hypothetical protein